MDTANAAPFAELRIAFLDEHRSRIERYLHLTKQPFDIIAAHYTELDEISRVVENAAYARYAALRPRELRDLIALRSRYEPSIGQFQADYLLIFGKEVLQVILADRLALDGKRPGYNLRHGGYYEIAMGRMNWGKGHPTSLGRVLGLSGNSYETKAATKLYARLTEGNSPITAGKSALHKPRCHWVPPPAELGAWETVINSFESHRDKFAAAYFLLLVPAYLLAKFSGFVDFNFATRLLLTLPMILIFLHCFRPVVLESLWSFCLGAYAYYYQLISRQPLH